MIGIRVDANERIAMGHVMRCLAIALSIRECGSDVIFIMSENYGGDFIAEKGFEYIVLHNDYNKKLTEISEMYDIIEKKNIDVLLVDSYQITALYMSCLKSKVKLVYIDDMENEKYPVDLLINYTLGTEMRDYIAMGYKEEKLLLGSEFVPLRPEFQYAPIPINENVESIFITTGGTDEFRMVTELVEVLCRKPYQHLNKVVVVGKFFKDDKKIIKLKDVYGNIVFYKDIKEICSVMKSCDVAISAGGTTLAELSACGIPTICFSVADNQLRGTKAYHDKGIMYYAGDVRYGKQGVIRSICEELLQMMKNQDIRRSFAQRARNRIDGYGSVRIAKEIINEERNYAGNNISSGNGKKTEGVNKE